MGHLVIPLMQATYEWSTDGEDTGRSMTVKGFGEKVGKQQLFLQCYS
jgi:hypothetical protein